MKDQYFDFTTSKIPNLLRGHLFLFDKPQIPSYTSKQGLRLLLIFISMEVLIRPVFFYGSRQLAIVTYTWWSFLDITILCFLSFALVFIFSKIKKSQLGLYSWSHWSKTEKLYLIQIIPITILVFSCFNFSSLKILFSRPAIGQSVLFTLIPQLIWGFYQEFLYRGILQTELVRRLGVGKGILASNLIFTFGPLHAYHFLAAQKNPSHLFIFVAIFCIGIFFSILFKRSGNLWIIGIMHGLGDLFIEGLAKI
jgi:membrane protease YdiL (CAAX protease family)